LNAARNLNPLLGHFSVVIDEAKRQPWFVAKDLAKQISSAVVFEFVSDPLFRSVPVRKPHLIGVGKIPTQHMDKNDLVKLVSSKTGLNEEMATLAVDTVIGFLKQKLPPELSGQLDSLLSGQESSSGIMDAVKGLFGKKDS
jgi:hypothetical protein